MDSKEPHHEYDDYEDDEYDLSHTIPEEISFKTPAPGQVQQLKPYKIDPHRTVRIKEGTPKNNATKLPEPSAPTKSIDGLRESRLTRANLFHVENNTETRYVPQDDDQQDDCDGN